MKSKSIKTEKNYNVLLLYTCRPALISQPSQSPTSAYKKVREVSDKKLSKYETLLITLIKISKMHLDLTYTNSII